MNRRRKLAHLEQVLGLASGGGRGWLLCSTCSTTRRSLTLGLTRSLSFEMRWDALRNGVRTKAVYECNYDSRSSGIRQRDRGC